MISELIGKHSGTAMSKIRSELQHVPVLTHQLTGLYRNISMHLSIGVGRALITDNFECKRRQGRHLVIQSITHSAKFQKTKPARHTRTSGLITSRPSMTERETLMLSFPHKPQKYIPGKERGIARYFVLYGKLRTTGAVSTLK